MKKNFRRHGDLNLHPVTKIEGKVVKHTGSFVLQEGETTGHKHVITTPRLEDMEVRRMDDGSICLTLKAEGTLTHEDHKKIIVMPGTYKIVQEREVDHFSESIVRKVID